MEENERRRHTRAAKWASEAQRKMAAMMMDSPGTFDEEEGDAVFPCKGCGDVCTCLHCGREMIQANPLADT